MSELPPKDKRTKEFKKWKAKHAQASEGVGDSISKFTEATGIKKAVKWLAGEDCGCSARQKKMNDIWRYKKPECLTEQEFNLIKMAIDTKKVKFTIDEQEAYKNIYERIFKTKVECTPCSFAKVVWKDLVGVYNLYLG
jgi:hypothetical protein